MFKKKKYFKDRSLKGFLEIQTFFFLGCTQHGLSYVVVLTVAMVKVICTNKQRQMCFRWNTLDVLPSPKRACF